jgi:hypothetical protein
MQTDGPHQHRIRWQNARSVVGSARRAAAGPENIDPASCKSTLPYSKSVSDRRQTPNKIRVFIEHSNGLRNNARAFLSQQRKFE